MRTYWLGVAALLFTAGCTHEGLLRPKTGAIPLTEEGTAAVTGDKGVTLVAYGSSWKGRPRNLEQQFTPVEIRLENHSGRALSLRYDGFELAGHKQYVARNPNELRQLLAARNTNYRPPRDNSRGGPTGTYKASRTSSGQPAPYDMTYTTHNGVSPYTPPPCYTCTDEGALGPLPSSDMLSMALGVGTLEDGQVRQGFLYFEESLRQDDEVLLKVKLVDASTGAPFGTLSVPFEVH